MAQGRSTWAEGSCEPERFIVAGDKIVVFLHVRVRLKDQTEWLDGHTADVYTFRNGKAIEFRTFANERQALEWAGAEPGRSMQGVLSHLNINFTEADMREARNEMWRGYTKDTENEK